MRITKRQLKRIIKEERAKLFKEWTPADAGFAAARDDDRKRAAREDLYVNLTDDQSVALDELENALAMCLKAGVSDAEINDTVESNLISGQLGKR